MPEKEIMLIFRDVVMAVLFLHVQEPPIAHRRGSCGLSPAVGRRALDHVRHMSPRTMFRSSPFGVRFRRMRQSKEVLPKLADGLAQVAWSCFRIALFSMVAVLILCVKSSSFFMSYAGLT